MRLDEFMKREGLDDAAMAERIGDVSEHGVKKWRYLERTPRAAQMQRILEATGGEVTPNDFLPQASAPPSSEAA